MGFFEYRQNNSGGVFDYNAEAGISVHVIVEAENVQAADARAQQIGLYFNGCDTGQDCDCCGDRWSAKAGWWDESAGDAVPSIYGTPVEQYAPAFGGWWIEDDYNAYVHYADGTVKGFHPGPKMTEGGK